MRSLVFVGMLLWSSGLAQWDQLPDFPGTARDDAASFRIGSLTYFGTGMEVGWSLTNDWWAFDVVGWGQWYSVPSMPASPRQYCVGFSQGYPRGYVFGGLDASGPVNELWAFDQGTSTWTPMAPLPAAGRYACTGFVAGGKGYVVGGLLAGGVVTNECWQYDPTIDSWTQVADIPGPARHRSASFDVGIVAGGADSAFHALSDVWKYDPFANQWDSLAPLPEPRYGMSAMNAGWLSGIIGGVSDDSTFHADAFEYWAPTDTWTSLGDVLPYGIRGGSCAYAEGGGGYFRLVFGTGIDSAFVRHREMYTNYIVFSVNEHDLSSLELSPNPGMDGFNIQLPTSGPYQLSVVDLSGRRILDGSFTSPTIDASTWSAGTYLLQFTDQDGNRLIGRWVKL